jgi:hypothetical protein
MKRLLAFSLLLVPVSFSSIYAMQKPTGLYEETASKVTVQENTSQLKSELRTLIAERIESHDINAIMKIMAQTTPNLLYDVLIPDDGPSSPEADANDVVLYISDSESDQQEFHYNPNMDVARPHPSYSWAVTEALKNRDASIAGYLEAFIEAYEAQHVHN